MGSTQLPDHPLLIFDSLHEKEDSPTPGLVHRYPDKVLFLALDVCPVHCRFCARSYAIGGEVDTHEKVSYRPSKKRWGQAFAYIASRPEVEDVVISGGDLYMLAPDHLEHILEGLLSLPHGRRIRLATKGPAGTPMKILTHPEWTDTVIRMAEKGREMHKEVCLHTHFKSPNEVTGVSVYRSPAVDEDRIFLYFDPIHLLTKEGGE